VRYVAAWGYSWRSAAEVRTFADSVPALVCETQTIVSACQMVAHGIGLTAVDPLLMTANELVGVKLQIFFSMHHRYRPGDYETWKYIAPIQKAARMRKTFEYGTWGGEFWAEFAPNPGEIVVQEHWCSSGFANTDLDLQLKRHGIHKLTVIGLIAHTCIAATVRYAAELGYEVTVVKDATADYSDEMMHAAFDINIPNYADPIVTTGEVVASISSLEAVVSAQESSLG
jgi:ureidoacrylate peracid hydrolase